MRAPAAPTIPPGVCSGPEPTFKDVNNEGRFKNTLDKKDKIRFAGCVVGTDEDGQPKQIGTRFGALDPKDYFSTAYSEESSPMERLADLIGSSDNLHNVHWRMMRYIIKQQREFAEAAADRAFFLKLLDGGFLGDRNVFSGANSQSDNQPRWPPTWIRPENHE